jgi:hypothetical protein
VHVFDHAQIRLPTEEGFVCPRELTDPGITLREAWIFCRQHDPRVQTGRTVKGTTPSLTAAPSKELNALKDRTHIERSFSPRDELLIDPCI